MALRGIGSGVLLGFGAWAGWEAGRGMSENPLIGTWKLISCIAIRDNGNRVPVYGRNPIGRLYYDAHGNMSVHIMRRGRPSAGSGANLANGDELPESAIDGYQAYFSTYSVDTSRRIIHHKVLGSLFPDWTGSTQVRYYEMQSPDRLLLRSAPMGAVPDGHAIFELLWERISDEPKIEVNPARAIAHR